MRGKKTDAETIYKVMGSWFVTNNYKESALAILSIGALESGYGTSNIAQKTNNIWGYGATNSNPEGNAHRYDRMSEGAAQFAGEYMKTYYNGYGAKSVYDAGTGNNPAGKGYAYFDEGGINPGWAADVGSIMNTFYKAAGGAGSGRQNQDAGGGQAAPAKPQAQAQSGDSVNPLESYTVSSKFGPRTAPAAGASTQHNGIDLAAPEGTPVRSYASGEVVASSFDSGGGGWYVAVRHPDGTTTKYLHMQTRGAPVGTKVNAGTQIGKVGSTGVSTGPHLDFRIQDAKGNYLNPEGYLR
jgi:murein DD-endopeptidase MepM/ murein hydrolase activator NlpD